MDIPMTPAERGQYGIARAKDQMFDAALELWRQRRDEGLTINDICARIGRSPRWVNRALSGPAHWTITTFGQLIEALDGDTAICVLPDKAPLAQVLSDRLRNKTRLLSSTRRMTEMPEFQKLVDLGDDTVRYILREMWFLSVTTVWFPLLRRITGENPVPPDERGRVNQMRERWVAWGEEHGFFGSEKNSCIEEKNTI